MLLIQMEIFENEIAAGYEYAAQNECVLKNLNKHKNTRTKK